MRAEPHVLTKADPAALLPLFGGALEGDPLVGLVPPPEAFTWSDAGMPFVPGLTYEPQEADAPDDWDDPITALKKGRGDCAAIVRVYGHVWGTHIAMTRLQRGPRGGKLHILLMEGEQRFDPSAVHGMEIADLPPDLVLRPIVRPASPLAEAASQVAAREQVKISPWALRRLAFAAKAPSRLRAVAKQIHEAPMTPQGDSLLAGTIEPILAEPLTARELLAQRGTRPYAAVALVYVFAVAPSVLELVRRPAAKRTAAAVRPAEVAGAELVPGLEDLARIMNPGCGGGCDIP